MRPSLKTTLSLSALSTVFCVFSLAHAFGPPNNIGQLVVHEYDLAAPLPIIRVEGGSAGTRAYLARRLQKRLRARAVALGLDPSRIYVDPTRLAPTNLSQRKLDVYLREVYAPKKRR